MERGQIRISADRDQSETIGSTSAGEGLRNRFGISRLLRVRRPGAPAVNSHFSQVKWIAEDTFVETALRFLWKRDPQLRSMFRLARGKRIYAIWSARDPLPFLVYWFIHFLPRIITTGISGLWSAIKRKWSLTRVAQEKHAT